MLQAPIDPPEENYSNVRDWREQPMPEGELYLSMDGFNVPAYRKEEFLEWYIDNYRHEAEEHIWELFEFAGSYFEA